MRMGDMMKSPTSKSLVIKINLIFLALFLVIYITLLLQPPTLIYNPTTTPSIADDHCSMHDCPMKQVRASSKTSYADTPTIFKKLFGDGTDTTIALVNINDWGSLGESRVVVEFDRVSENFEWKDLFPEWIDEEEENEGPSCPEIPMPDFSLYEEVDVVVARVPCKRSSTDHDERDVFRLQVHLIVANMAARRGRRDGGGKVRVVIESECRPMMEVFRCDDVVGREGRWWVFEVEGVRLEEKLALPVGSCKLALPLWEEGT